MRKLSFLWIVALSLAPRQGLACSMCHCGDPVLNLVGSQIFVPGTWHVGFDTDRFAKDQVAEDDPGTREKEVESRFTLSVSRTFGRRLTVVARLPFAHRSIDAPDGSSSLTGLSDPEVLAHYRIYAPQRGSWLSLSLGLRSGWGKNDAARDGERLEEHLQPGTGSAGVEPGLSFSRVVGSSDDSSVFGSVAGRFNGRNDVGYHYGNAMLANLGFEKKLSGRLNAIVEANFRRAAKDEPTLGGEDPNTGGSVLYLSPRLLVRLDQSLFLRVGVQVPVVKDLYGDQNEKVNLLTGLTLRF